MIRNTTIMLFCAAVFIGCSPKSQIAPLEGEYAQTEHERSFKAKQEINKKVEAAYSQGKSDGYDEAKAEFEKIIPYLEAIRASAELKGSGGLCLPPLFLDKSSSSRVAVVLGEAHVCDSFTVDNVLAAVKSGIPGLPAQLGKIGGGEDDGAAGISNVRIAGLDARDFFTERVTAAKQRISVVVADTYTNREVLRNSNFTYAKSEIGEENSLVVEFANKEEAEAFCEKYSICKKGS